MIKTRLVAGVDVSGRRKVGNRMFMAVVIGTEERIKSIAKPFEGKTIHMNTLSLSEKKRVIAQTKFHGDDCMAFCFEIHLDETIDGIKETMRKNGSKINKPQSRKMSSAAYYITWRLMREHMMPFLNKYRRDQYDVIFQSDMDCIEFLKVNGLTSSAKGVAHMLCDIVASGNNKNIEPDGVISKNLTDRIKEQMERSITTK